jgi:hypothetical protein
MRSNVSQSTCKSSKQTQHVSGSLCGCGGLVLEDDPADDDLVDLEAVDVVSVALPFLSMGVEELEFESIPLQ